MSFIVVYDANVLYPSTLRDLLIRIAQAGLVQAKWTDRILDEMFDSLMANRPDLKPAALARTRELMNAAVRDCLITGYEPVIAGLDLPDADDRHVVAAAIRAHAQVIVTANTKHFPATSLALWDVGSQAPGQLRAGSDRPRRRCRSRRRAHNRLAWRNPPGSPREVLERLEASGLPRSAHALARLI